MKQIKMKELEKLEKEWLNSIEVEGIDFYYHSYYVPGVGIKTIKKRVYK